MKKLMIVGITFIGVVAFIGVAGYTFAKAQDTQTPGFAYRMHGEFSEPDTMLASGGQLCPWEDIKQSLLYPYLIDFFADAFDMTPAQLTDLHANGKTLWQIARNLDIGWKEFRELMYEAYIQAADEALQDNVITQQQADGFRQYANWIWATSGYFGPCTGGGGWFRGRERERFWRGPTMPLRDNLDPEL